TPAAAPDQPVTAPDTADRTAAPTPPPPAPATPPPPPAATPPPPPPRPAVAVAVAAAPLGVQPPAVVETVPAGSGLSPMITFTVTATGPSPVTVGTVTTTAPAFHIVRDGCSRARLAPGGGCSVTVQLSATTPGHQTGSLLVPVEGMRPASARLEGTVR
ncbi:MAG: hypothetical protein JWM18_1609, partial [Chloroflexi bacterium]|nr:hypothetical protein [Chloroflexota bacterium]